MKILVVDDRPENNYLLESLLQGKGNQVFSAANGKEALEILKEQKIDLIITDILMPVMDGFQLCRKVKTDPQMHSIPLIFYTATYTGPKDEEFAIQIGADRFVVKPCEPGLLLQIIEEVLAESKDTKPLAATENLPEEDILMLYNERLVRKLEQKVSQYEKELKERRKVEENLRESEEKFRALFNQSFEGIYLHDLQGNLIVVNDMACLQSGYTAEELLNLTVFDLHPDESNKNMPKLEIIKIWNSWQPAKPHKMEAEHKRKNGTIYPVEINTGIIRLRNKNIIMAIVKDLTQRKLTEAERQKYKANLEEYFHNDISASYVAGVDGEVFSCNHTFMNLFNVGQEFQKDKLDITDFFLNPDDRKNMLQMLRLEKKVENYEVDFQTSDGQIINAIINAIGIFDAEGHLEKVRGFVVDITKQKKAEAELQSIKESLEIQVAEKTRELKERISELERFHDATIQREFRIKELREEIARLKEKRE